MRAITCTAEPFGYGPSSSLAQIVTRMASLSSEAGPDADDRVRALAGIAQATYLGSGHTLDFAHKVPAYGGRIEPCTPAQFAERVRGADAALIVTDFAAAEAAKRAGVPFAIYDPLAWYWPETPAIARDADLYLCQDFFGVRERLARDGVEAVVVPPLTPQVEPIAAREGILVSLGGLGNPFFTAERCIDYARAVLAALRRAIAGEPGPLTSLTSKQVADSLPGLEVATLAPAEVHRRIAQARVCFLTPGLGQLYEASALDARAVWLPPANDSQGRQLREVAARGMAPGAIDWHEFMDVPRIDYASDQPGVMRTLSSYMDRLLRDERAQARLSATVRARMIAVRDAPDNPLAGLVTELGSGGAAVAARVLDAWVRTLDEPRRVYRGGRRLGTSDPPSSPRLAPLVIPRENRASEYAIGVMRRLHAEVDGSGFHTLATALELLRETATRTQAPRASDFTATLASWRASGLALWHKYRAGNCTALAEVLRAKIQEATGLAGQIVCVRYADSRRPLSHAWEYTGTVHADLLVPFLDHGRVRAVHVVCGLGVADHFHLLEGEDAILAHLDELAYARGAVIDPGELTRTALGTKDKLWIVEGPELTDASRKLGIDVIAGSVFLNRAAAAQYRGPRPAAPQPRYGRDEASDAIAVPFTWATDGGTRELIDAHGRSYRVPSATALRDVLGGMAAAFAQPADFVDNVVYLATHVEAWCDATLCEPGRSLRRARGRADDAMDEPSELVAEILAIADRGGDPLALRVAPAPAAVPRALSIHRLADQLAAVRSLPHAAITARLALAAEAVRLAAAVPARELAAVDPDDDAPPSVLDPPLAAAAEDDTLPGLRFDAAKQTYVAIRIPRVLVHALHLRLAQFLDWELEDRFIAARELVDRLVAHSIDPGTGEALADGRRLAEIVAAIADAAPADDPALAALAASPVDVWVWAGDGGDRVDRIEWRLRPASEARLYALLDDARLRGHLFAVAAAQRSAAHDVIDQRRRALAAVLEQHRGLPRRHKRAHWALLNLASAGQTVAEMRRTAGVLPAEATTLDPRSLRSRYHQTSRLAVRFVLNDRFELNILDDARYWSTIARFGFPPNHETLSSTRPILASGYLTIERGQIVAIEDDGVMVPGKLPEGMPPILEVVEALGFAIDLDRVAGASLVIDWEGFAEVAEAAPPEEEVDADPDRFREYLASRSHGERARLVVTWIRRASIADRDHAASATAKALRGFRLINTSARSVAIGDLPKHAEWIDEALARYLVRKVVGR